MLAVVINDSNAIDLHPIIKRIRAMYIEGVPFYNTLTMRIELAKKPFKGIYPPSILAHGNVRNYTPTITHYSFQFPIESSPTLRPYQIPVFKEFMETYNSSVISHRPCVAHIQAPCGFGKSETSLKIITCLKIKTVIVVKTKNLVCHWCHYFATYGINHLGSYDGATVLLKNLIISNPPDVLVIVSRHIENDDFVSYLQSNYSICLVDEIHSWALSNHSELSKFLITNPFPVNIYLTATPNKTDLPALGKIIKAEDPPELLKLVREIVTYSMVDNNIVTNDESTVDEQLDSILSDKLRNRIIVTCILNNLTSCSIVYCNRRRHMDILYNTVIRSIYNTELIKDVKHDDITLTFTIHGKEYIVLKGDAENPEIHWKIKGLSNYSNFVLITTVQFCGCGVDLPKAHNVMLALTSIDENTLKQAAGRVQRSPYEGVRKIFLFCTTEGSGMERVYKNPNTATKTLAYKNHPNLQYTNLYEKFILDYKSIKNTLSLIGWHDTSSKAAARRRHYNH